MIRRLKTTPKILYVTIAFILAIFFFMFYSFNVDEDAVVEGYKSNMKAVQKEAAIENVAKQVSNIKSSQAATGTVASADVDKIIKMSDKEVWQLISEGKYSSYSEANTDALSNWNTCKAYWEGLLVDVEVPVWKWDNKSKATKKSGKATITVNKYLADYFTAYMTDLYNLPEKYVIESVGGFSFRMKNNKSSKKSVTGHAFGATLDINAWINGMSSVPAGPYNGIPASYGIPWATQDGLQEPLLSTCCTYGSDWEALAKKYDLNWGGNFSSAYTDPMHFSLVGDENKDTRKFQPKVKGRTP